MEKQIVYILSTNYAGSHFLALQLGSHSQCASIGELHHHRRKVTHHRACHHCESDDICPVFAGLRKQGVKHFYDTIFSNLAVFNGCITTVIDNSKKIRWVRRFLKTDGYTRKYIHLIRDPRALVRRWMISFDKPTKKKMRIKTARHCWRHAWDILTGDEANIYIWDWLYENQQITHFIEKNKLDAKLVTYSDLVSNPDEVLSDLMCWLGHDYEPSQKNYWEFTHHSSVKPLYMKAPDTERALDQRWKTFLTEEAQSRILHHSYINLYLSDLGLVFDKNKGLDKRINKCNAIQ